MFWLDEATLDELNEKSEILMSDDNVLYAGYDYPISISNTAISDPWTDDSENPERDRGNEQKPKGNDWWAEAIGAYTAWDNAKNTKKIKIGIIDSGFDSDHEDLRDSISFLPDYTETSKGDHGTHVTGLIGAKNNSVGIRGVADNAELICCDWNPREEVNYLSSGEFMEIMKQMIESGVRVINNSWGQETQSKEAFVNDFTSAIKEEKKAANANSIIKQYIIEYSINNKYVEAAVDKTELYEKYLSYSKYVSEMQGIYCILLLAEVILSGKDDFLIVQGAGNGYDRDLLKDGIDTIYSGAFCAVGENVFNKLSESTRKKMSEAGITYKKIKDHIIIVGAVENKKDKNGNYQMTTWSNYGNNVDICAPGLNVYSTLFNDTYGYFSGTSMATPIVSGAAALLWSCDMTKSAAEIKKELIKSCTVKAIGVGNGKGKTYPMLNIEKAIKRQNKTASSAENYEDFEEMMDYVLESGLLENFDIENFGIKTIISLFKTRFGFPFNYFLKFIFKYQDEIEKYVIKWIMEQFEELK